MIPTKYSTLTNQEVIDKLAKIVAKRKDNSEVVLMEPYDASEILLEAQNRIENLENILTNPWIPAEQLLPPMVEDWDSDWVSKQVIVLLENGEVSKDIYWKDKKTNEGGWSFSSIKVTHWMPFIEPQKGGQR